MKKYLLRNLLLFALFLYMSAFCMADDQEFSISGIVQGENTAPVLAVNSETGDVLAVWESRGEDDVTIYSALVRRVGGGTYIVKKRQILWAPEDGGFYQSPYAAFNPVDKSYLVVCHNGFTGHAYAQVIRENGSKKGDPKMISGTDKWMSTVKTCFIPDSEAKYTSGAFMAVFNMGYDIDYWYDNGLYKHGLYSAVLSDTGELMTKPKLLLKTKIKGTNYYYKYPCELVLGRANSYFLSYSNPKPLNSDAAGYIMSSFSAMLNSSGKLIKTKKVGAKNSVGANSIIKLKPTRYIFVYEDNTHLFQDKKSTYKNCLLNANLGILKKDIKPFRGRTLMSSCAVKLMDDPGAYQLSFPHDQEYIWGAYMDQNGKVGEWKELFEHNSTSCPLMCFVTAVGIPATNEIFVVWQRIMNYMSEHELMARVMSVK